MEKVKIVLADKGAKMPTKVDEGSAGFDLYTSETRIIHSGRNLLPTGLQMQIPYGWEGHIRPRSGFSLKGIEGWTMNTFHTNQEKLSRFDAHVIQGTIDSSYRGKVCIIVYNSDDDFVIPAGTRLAQIIFEQHYTDLLQLVDQLDDTDTDRGTGGFGHSGTR